MPVVSNIRIKFLVVQHPLLETKAEAYIKALKSVLCQNIMLQFWTVGCGYVYYNIMVHGIAVLIAGGHIQYMCYLKLLTLIS